MTNRYPFSRSLLPSLPTPQRQRGAVLIIALVMLLILTLIGIAGLRDTQLQERMAGGAQDRELALQAAEAALRAAEADIASGAAAAGDSGTTAQYKNYEASETPNDNVADLQRTNGGTPVTEAAYWRDVYDWTGNSGNNSFILASSLSGLASQPLYVIERLPYNYSAVAGSWNVTNATTTGTPKITDYIITARGVGSTPDAVVILQSQYRDVYVHP